MNRLNEWLQVISNLGVLLGIVFLAMEISQNTQATKAEIYQTRAFENAASSLAIAQSDVLIRILASIRSADGKTDLNAIDSLSEIDRLRLEQWVGAQLRNSDNNLYQCELGYLEEAFCREWRTVVVGNLPVWKRVNGGPIPPIYHRIAALDTATN